jgi:hypothetical protein
VNNDEPTPVEIMLGLISVFMLFGVLWTLAAIS